MTPTGFLIQHRETVLELANKCSASETWRTLVEKIGIDKAMKENSFKVLLKPFMETCSFFDYGLNEKLHSEKWLNRELQEQIDGLNEKLNNEQELNEKLNTQIDGLNTRLNTLDGLNEKLNNGLNVPVDGLNTKLNTSDAPVKSIAGWTITQYDKYFRAFRKIKGKVHGVHLGRTLTDAEQKIQAKEQQLNSESHSNTATDT